MIIYKKIIIRLFFSIVAIGVFYITGLDYFNFNSITQPYDYEENLDLIVVGNKYVPEDSVVDIVYGSKENFYTYIIKELRIVNISNSRKLILVKEDFPRFYDEKIIYLAS